MAIELGTAFVNIVPSARGIEQGVARELLPIEAAAAATGKRAGTRLSSGILTQMGGLKSVLPVAAFAAFGVAAFKSAESVHDANVLIQRSTGASGEAAEKLEASFKNVAKRTPASFQTVAKALAEVTQRTGLLGKPLEDLTLKVVTFNRISGQSVGVQQLTRVMAAFNIPAAKMSAELDRLFIAGQKTGLPIEQLMGTLNIGGPFLRQFGFDLGQSAVLLGTLDKAGVPARIAVTGLRIAFAKFSKEGQEPKKALHDVLAEITNLGKAGDVAAARKLGVQVFGARGSGLVDAALSGKLNLDKLSTSLKLTGDGILKTASKTGTLSGKFGILKNNLSLALAQLATPVLETANTTMAKLLPVINGVVAGFSKLPGPVQQGVIGLTAFAVAIGPLRRLGGFVGGIGRSFGAMAGGIQRGVVGALNGLGRLRGGFRSTEIAQAQFSGVMGTIGGKLRIAFDGARGAALGLGNSIKTAALSVRAFAGSFLSSLAALPALIGQATIAMLGLDAAMDANVIGLIVIGIAALVAGFILALKYIGPFRDAMKALGTAILGGLTAVFNFVKQHWIDILGLILLPFGPGLVILIAHHFDAVVAFFRGLPAKIVGALGDLGALLVDVGRKLIGGLVQGIEFGLAALIVSIIGIPFLIVTKLIPLAARLVPIGVEWLTGIVTGLVSAVPRVLAFFASLPGRIIGAVASLTTVLVGVGVRMMLGFLQAEIRGFVAVAAFLRSLPGRIIDAVGNASRWLLAVGQQAMRGLVAGLVAGAGAVFSFLRALPGRILAAAGDSSRWLSSLGVRAIEGLVEALVAALPAVERFFASLPDKIVDAVGDIGAEMEKIGEAIVDGIVAGIGDVGSVVFDHLKSGLGGVVDKVKGFLGIGSPSKVFAEEIGKPIPQGIAQGIDSAAHEVGVASQDVAKLALQSSVDAFKRGDTTQQVVAAYTDILKAGAEGAKSEAEKASEVGKTATEHMTRGFRDGRSSVVLAATDVATEAVNQAKSAAQTAADKGGPITLSFRSSIAGAPQFGSESDIISQKAIADAQKALPKQLQTPLTGPFQSNEAFTNTNAILAKLAPLVPKISAQFATLNQQTLKSAGYQDALFITGENLVKGFGLQRADAQKLAVVLLQQATSQQANVTASKDMVQAQSDLQSANASLTKQLKESKGKLGDNTQEARDSKQAFQDAGDKVLAFAQAQIRAGVPMQTVARTVGDQANAMQVLAIKAGLSKTAAAQMTATLLGIPPETVANIKSNADVQKLLAQEYSDVVQNTPTKHGVAYSSNAKQAKTDAGGVTFAIDSVPGNHKILFISNKGEIIPVLSTITHAIEGVPTEHAINFRTTVNGKFVNPNTGASIQIKGPNVGATTIPLDVQLGVASSPIKYYKSTVDAGRAVVKGLTKGINQSKLPTIPLHVDPVVVSKLGEAAGREVVKGAQRVIAASQLDAPHRLLARVNGLTEATFGQSMQRSMNAVEAAISKVGAATRRLEADQARLANAGRRVTADNSIVNAAQKRVDAAKAELKAAQVKLVIDTAAHASDAQIAADKFAVGLATGKVTEETKKLNAAEKQLDKDRKAQKSMADQVNKDTQALRDARQAERDATDALRTMVDTHDSLVAQLGTSFDSWLERLKLPQQYFDDISQAAVSMAQSVRSTFEQLTNVATGGLRDLSSGRLLEHTQEWAAAIQQMEALGLAPQLIAQFIQAGPTSFREAQRLVAGGQPLVDQLNAATGQIWAIENQTFQQAIARFPEIVLPPWAQNPNEWAAAGVKPKPVVQNTNHFNVTGVMDAKTAALIQEWQDWAAVTSGATVG